MGGAGAGSLDATLAEVCRQGWGVRVCCPCGISCHVVITGASHQGQLPPHKPHSPCQHHHSSPLPGALAAPHPCMLTHASPAHTHPLLLHPHTCLFAQIFHLPEALGSEGLDLGMVTGMLQARGMNPGQSAVMVGGGCCCV